MSTIARTPAGVDRSTRWHRPAAAAAAMTLSVVGLTTAGATAASTAAPTAEPATEEAVLVGGFEDSSEGWVTSVTGDGLVGSFERVVAADAPQGSTVGEVFLDASDAASGGFVEVARPVPAIDVGELVLAIKAPDLTRIVVRLMDSTGQVHQTSHVLADTADWQTVTVADPTVGASYSSWGGAADGQWHGPAIQLALLVDSGLRRVLDGVRPDQVTVQVDDVHIVPPPTVAPAIALGQAVVGNVFIGDAEVTIPYEASAETLRWRLVDSAEVTLATGEVDAQVGDSLTFAGLDLGWYGLSVEAWADGAVIGTAATTLARIAEHTAASDSPFGVATHYGQSWSTDSIPLIYAAGLRSQRDEIYWNALERQPGVYDWSIAGWMDDVADSGVQPLLLPGYGNVLYDDGNGPVSPEAIAAYAAYAAAMAERYAATAIGIEIWNEWDLGLGGNTNTGAAEYVALLEATAPAVRAVAPDLPIIGPAVAVLASPWLEETFQLGALDHLDGVVMHPYGFPAGAEALDGTIEQIDALVRQYNDGEAKPLWITEHGWPTGSASTAVSEEAQAANLAKSAAIAVARGVEQYYWYDLVNDGIDPADTENNFGLLHHPADALGAYTPKPGYVAYATAAARLDDVTFVTRDDSVADVWNLAYSSDGGEVADLHVLWSDLGRGVSVRSAQPFTVTTTYGASTTYAPGSSAGVVLQLTSEPVYVSGEIESVTADASALTIDPGHVGQELRLQWTADNTAETTERTYELEVEGLPEPLAQTVPGGSTGTVDFALPAPTAVGVLRVEARLSADGADLGRLSATVTVREAVTLSGGHTIDADGVETLRLRVTNHADVPVTVQDVAWSVGQASGSALSGQEIAARGTVVTDIPLDGLTGVTAWSGTVTVVGHAPVSQTGTLLPVTDVTDVVERTVVVDGVLDGLDDVPPVSLALGDDGDLAADLWLTWDDEALYLSAQIVDDVHHQEWTRGEIWRGDAVQLTIAAGAPGEQAAYQEIGLALTPAGVQAHRWLPGGDAGEVPGVVAAIVRDDTAGETVYEASFPWSSIGGWDPADGLFSSAIAINENDGDGREFVEWGGGIVESKDPTLFNALRALPATGPVPGERPVVSFTAPSAGQTLSGVVAVSGTATDDHGLLDDTVALHLRPLNGNGNCGAFVRTWTVPVVEGTWHTTIDTGEVDPGQYCLTALTRDDAGQENPGGGTHLKFVTIVDRLPRLTGLNARAQCIDGRAHVAVYAVNGESVPVDIRLSVAFGDRKFNGVQPGAGAYAIFDSGQAAVTTGAATVAGYFWDGAGHHEVYQAAYAGADCG